jgi:hypothetical protein
MDTKQITNLVQACLRKECLRIGTYVFLAKVSNYTDFPSVGFAYSFIPVFQYPVHKRFLTGKERASD